MTDLPRKSRLDVLLVERGLCATRARARDTIKRGEVTVADCAVTKPGQLVDQAADIQVAESANPYVSRGGLKLVHALDAFAIDVAGLTALDLGASTGGFTDVLLRRGAGKVYAVDVGHGQLHDSLREDERVVSLEGLNARHLTAEHIPEPPDIIVCDVSFISLKTALPASLALAQSGCRLVALIKPQFEVGRERLGKGGIVRDPALHDEICSDIRTRIETHGWSVEGIEPSPIEGPDGNREFLLVAVRP